MRLETKLIHAGEPRPRIAGAVSLPVFQSSTFESGGETGYHDVRYIRLNNTPNHIALHAKLAALEGSEAALVTASGMAAISTTFLTVLKPGDHFLAYHCLYGGTGDLIRKDLAAMGIECTFLESGKAADWERAVRSTTRAVYVEAFSNPLLEVVDLQGIAALARAKGLLALIDNTLASPVNFRPLEHGYHLVLHSATKYLNGHTDIVAGAVMGSTELVNRIKHKLDHLGGVLDPHACFLLRRGLMTLALRVRYQNESALRVAEFLERHPAVAKVNYPGLRSHPEHARAQKLFAGFAGLLSFELKGGLDAAEGFLKRLELPANAPSLGGPETLITRPAVTSHAGSTPEERRRQGIADGLIRVSIGLEATEDLLKDFGQALEAAT